MSSHPGQPEPLMPRQAATASQPIARLLCRAVLLRCPACGRAKLFRGWFTMFKTCPSCGRLFHRDAGYFLGSIYFNYAVTGLAIIAIYFAMYFGDVLTDPQRFTLLVLFVVLFPLWFFRYARALWMAFDEYWDPWPSEAEARGEAPTTREST